MSNSRNTIFIDRKVQGALARRIAIHWCTFVFLAFVCLFAQEYFLGEPNQGLFNKLGAVANEYAFFFLLLLGMVPAFIYDTIKLSNRFVGPVLRLKNFARSVADGKPVSPLKFRGGDFWHELADDFNRLNEKLGGPVHIERKDVGKDLVKNETATVVAPVNIQAESSNTLENNTQNAAH